MSAVGQATKRTFQSLSVHNYRLYFIGQLISISGTWMQSVAQAWLILKLTNSGFALGIAIALQFLPTLLAGGWGGLIVDRMSKRKILYVTQTAAGLLALTLGILVELGHVHPWEVFMMAFLLGVVNVFDLPARQTFVQEMVGRELLTNAVSLNSVLMNSGRIIGPAFAGIMISTAGIPACFFANALSFGAVILALTFMDGTELRPMRTVTRAKGQLRAGFAYAFHDSLISSVLVTIAVVGVFAFNFNVTVPLLVRNTFGGSAATYGLFMGAMGVGAVLGGLIVAHRSRPSLSMLTMLCLAFGVLMLGVAVAPSEWIAVALMVPMGAASLAFISTANAALQISSREEMRGRVMALYSIGFLGSTPIGAPLVGAIAMASNPRIAILVGGVATLLACVPLVLVARKRRAKIELEGLAPIPSC
jgi:MFS family permease